MASSSSPCLSSSSSSAVYIGVINLKRQLEFYSFPLSGGFERGGLRGFVGGDVVPFPTPFGVIPFLQLSSPPICIGDGFVYLVGGDRGETRWRGRTILSLDVKTPPCSSSAWSLSPTLLISSRTDPRVVALNGKVYVIGGNNSQEQPWAEVFEPQSSSSLPLSSPPSPKPSDSAFFATADHDRDVLVVGSCLDKFLYVYDVTSNSWEYLEHEMMDNGPIHAQPICVGAGILLWFEDSKLHAYNLKQKWSSSGRIKGLKKIISLKSLEVKGIEEDIEDSPRYNPVLLHLVSDQFLWICFENTGRPITMLHCVKFTLRTTLPLKAVANSCQSCLINTPLLLRGALLTT